MTNMTPRNTPASESGEMAEAGLPAEAEAGSGDKSRRDALAVLAKHAAYTAPAVLTILSLTTKRAAAGSVCGLRLCGK
jgi:polyribonucleotide nucleotidyltransferase